MSAQRQGRGQGRRRRQGLGRGQERGLGREKYRLGSPVLDTARRVPIYAETINHALLEDSTPVTGTLIALKNLIKDLAFVGVFYVIFTTFGYASFHIPSGSMEPTLEVGDRVFVNKFTFGYNRYSAYFDPAFLPEDRLFEGLPDRGDVVVFTLPNRGSIDFIKRVIGLPGDRVQMRGGRLYINGELVAREAVRDLTYRNYDGGTPTRVTEYIETLPGGVQHKIYERTDRALWDNTPEYLIPEDHYFMMGDNRDGSSDSRNIRSMGFVPAKYLMGRADITTFSLYDCDQGKPVACAGPVPYGRFFNLID